MTACAVCGGTRFADFSGRIEAVCTLCGSLERHRALVRACANRLSRGHGRAVLEIGPLSEAVYGDYLRRRGWSYTAVDKWRTGNPSDPRAVGFIDREADIADLAPFPDHEFDLVIVQHVIEEVPDYEAALVAIRRVLKPSGTALLEIPYEARRETSEAHPPDGYGNVWSFGRDLIDRLRAVFGGVEFVPLSEGAYGGELMVCGRLDGDTAQAPRVAPSTAG